MAGEGIEVEVYRFNTPTVKAGTLYGRADPKFMRQLNANGGGSISINKNDPKLLADPTLIAYRNILKLKVDGSYRGAFVIKNFETTYISSGENSGEAHLLSGPGLRCWTEDAEVYPLQGLSAQSGDNRVFNFATERGSWYDASKWTAPYVIASYGGGQWQGRPTDWPANSGSKWIWGASYSYPGSVPDGARTLFRYEFTVTTAGTYRIYAAGDNYLNAWLDGAQVLTTDLKASAFDKANKIEAYLTTGSHYLSFEVTNGLQVITNPAGLLMAMYRVDSNNNEVKFGQSDNGSSWLSYYNPPTMPGWSSGEILLKLLNEAKTRGVTSLNAYVPSFTATTDSAGLPWTNQQDWSFSVGSSISDAISKMEELGCYVVVDPDTYALHMYQSRGVDRSVFQYAADGITVVKSPVIFQRGKNLTAAGAKGQGHITNTLAMKTADGWYSAQDNASVATYGRIEGTLDVGKSSKDFGAQVATVLFGQKAQPEEGATYTIMPVTGAMPFVDFNEGDWVLAPDRNGLLVKRRVLSISIGEDAKTGDVTYTLEFDTIFKDTSDQLSGIIKKNGGGSGSGLANTAGGSSSVNPPIVIGPGNSQAPVLIPLSPGTPSGTSVGKWMPNGINTYAEETLTWPAVTGNTDGSATVPMMYEVQGWRTDQGTNAVQQFGTSANNSIVLTLTPGVEWNFQVRTVNPDGQRSSWSTVYTFTPGGPTAPMSTPSLPVLASSLGLLQVTWDGLMGGVQPPPQFRYVRVESSPYLANTWKQAGSVIQRGGGTISIPGLTVGSKYNVRLIGVDGAGIETSPTMMSATVVTNNAQYPTMEVGTPNTTIRTNLSTNPNGVGAVGFNTNNGAYWSVTRNVAITGHPQGITTAVKHAMVAGHPATNTVMSAYNLDSLGTSNPARYIGAWVYASGPGYQAYWLHDTISKAIPLTAGTWTFVPSLSQVAANTYSGFYVSKISGNVTDDTEYAYITGVTADSTFRVFESVWGGRAATADYSYAWSGATDASTSIQKGTLVTGASGITSIVSKATDKFHSGTASTRVITNGAGSAEGWATSLVSGSAHANTPVTASIWVWAPVGAALYLDVRLSNASSFSDAQADFTGTGAWQRVTVTHAPDAGGTSIQVQVRTRTTQAITFYLDDLTVTDTSDASLDFSGSSTSPTATFAWTASADASTSTLTPTGGSVTIIGVDLGGLDKSVTDAVAAAGNAALVVASSLNGLLIDGGFENNPLDHWILNDPNVTPQLTTNQRSGSGAIKIISKATAYTAVTYKETIPIDEGNDFLLKLWVRAGTAGAFVAQGVELGLAVGPTPTTLNTIISIAGSSASLNTAYSKISGKWENPVGSGYRYAVPIVTMKDTTAARVYYIDDMAMYLQTDQDLLVDGSVIADKLAAGAVIAGKVAAGAIDAVAIQASAITADKLAADSVTANAIATGAVTADSILAGSIKTNHLDPAVGSSLDISANDTVNIIAGQVADAQSSADDTAGTLDDMQTYYSFGPSGAIISNPGSPFQLALRSDKIEMLENGSTVSYWNSGQMTVNSFVGTEVVLGNHKLEKSGTGTVVKAL